MRTTAVGSENHGTVIIYRPFGMKPPLFFVALHISIFAGVPSPAAPSRFVCGMCEGEPFSLTHNHGSKFEYSHGVGPGGARSAWVSRGPKTHGRHASIYQKPTRFERVASDDCEEEGRLWVHYIVSVVLV